MKFFDELKRRNVVKETLAYLVVAWVLLQVASIMLPIFDAPDWVLKTITFTLIVGLPIWIFFSWTYQVTTEGFKKTSKISEEQSTNKATYKRLNIIIIIALCIAITIAVFDLQRTSAHNNSANDLALNNSIAVLPFTDMSPNKDQEYLSDGIADYILNQLCKFPELTVIASTSAFSFKDKDVDIKTIGNELDVNNILEGSVLKNETEIIIMVRLTNAKNGTILLSESYTDNIKNYVGLQSRIALDIAKKIESKLSNRSEQLLDSKKIDPIAFESFLKGRSHFVNGPLNMIPGEMFTAKKYFEAAIVQDSTFSEAHAYLALAYFNLADWALPRIEKAQIANALDSAKHLSIKAVLLDSLNSGAHLAMGSYYFHQFQWIEAEKEKRKAVTLNPGGLDEKFSLASFLGLFGQTDEALKLDKEAIRIDPLDVKSKGYYLRDLYRARKFDEAIRISYIVHNEKPNNPAPYQFLYLSYFAKKQYKETAFALAKFFELSGDSINSSFLKSGDLKSGIIKIIQHKYDPLPIEQKSPSLMAWMYTLLEEKDSTFKYLNLHIKKGLPQISYISQPNFDFLRNDPRYIEIYEASGLKAYHNYKLKEQSKDPL